MGRLDGKVCIITGASSGIGRATFDRFAREGATVVGAARRPALLDEALAAAESAGGRGAVVAADLTGEEGCAEVVNTTLERFGRVDVLVNNAGIGWAYGQENPGTMEGVLGTSLEEWRKVMAIDLDAHFVMSRLCLQPMIDQGGGSIVHVASMAGLTGLYDAHTYTAAKGALINLTKSMAITYCGQGVRTNAVCPGWVHTPMIEKLMDMFEDPEVATRLSPMQRAARPEEIAAAILFFADDDCVYANGSHLLVDGGNTARSFAL
jgi:NAD(P)-dependent dehydrogenase (short-subunit alcohol dehydrogenase family)